MSATSPWRTRARRVITEALASLPADATYDQKRRAINAVYPFGERNHHPYRIWLSEVRAALGPPPRPEPRPVPVPEPAPTGDATLDALLRGLREGGGGLHAVVDYVREHWRDGWPDPDALWAWRPGLFDVASELWPSGYRVVDVGRGGGDWRQEVRVGRRYVNGAFLRIGQHLNGELLLYDPDVDAAIYKARVRHCLAAFAGKEAPQP